jgi:hypothetical protein
VFSRCRETTCSQSCSLATGAVVSPVYTTANRQWVHMAQCSILKAALPKYLKAYRHFCFLVGPGRISESGRRSYISSTPAVGRLFFHLGGGRLLHSDLTLIFGILMEDVATTLTTSSTVVSFRVSLAFSLFPSFRLQPLWHCCNWSDFSVACSIPQPVLRP